VKVRVLSSAPSGLIHPQICIDAVVQGVNLEQHSIRSLTPF